MLRGNHGTSFSRRHGGPASRTMPLLITAGFFAVVMGVFVYASQRSTSPALSENADSATPEKTAQAESSAATVVTSPREETVQQLDVPVVQAAETSPSITDPAASRLERLTAQLQAGEFGPALATADSADDTREQSLLFKKVADVQLQLGDFAAAESTARRIPDTESRRQTGREQSVQQSLAGGSQADFTELKDLIKEVTTGLWEEEDGVGGTMSENRNGVFVDPAGLLSLLTRQEHTGQLNSLGIRARQADLNEDMARPSPLRLVSLTRLEKEVANRLADGLPAVETMQQLAGLTQIQYIFVYPEQNEIVIGGPAEGWQYNEHGQPVGAESGRPTLHLDDFVTVARTFAPGGNQFFDCSIDPRPEGLKSLREYVELSYKRGPVRSTAVRSWVHRMQEKLGLQDIAINGIPKDSRVARVIVEADYRMKLVGVGKLDGGPEVPSFFDLLPLNPAYQAPLDALRWWLTMKYDAVLHSPDHNVFEIRGSSVLCQSENQFISAQGKQIPTGKAEATNRMFAENFTRHYDELASRDVAFADLQNVFDLSLLAALIRHEGLADRIGWDLGVFSRDGAYHPAEYDPPSVVQSVANHRVYRGKDIVVQVGGGVRADLMSVVRDRQVVKESPRLANLADEGRAPVLPAGRWWWDAPR